MCYFNDSPSAECEDKIIRPVTGELNQIDAASQPCSPPQGLPFKACLGSFRKWSLITGVVTACVKLRHGRSDATCGEALPSRRITIAMTTTVFVVDAFLQPPW